MRGCKRRRPDGHYRFAAYADFNQVVGQHLLNWYTEWYIFGAKPVWMVYDPVMH